MDEARKDNQCADSPCDAGGSRLRQRLLPADDENQRCDRREGRNRKRRLEAERARGEAGDQRPECEPQIAAEAKDADSCAGLVLGNHVGKHGGRRNACEAGRNAE